MKFLAGGSRVTGVSKYLTQSGQRVLTAKRLNPEASVELVAPCYTDETSSEEEVPSVHENSSALCSPKAGREETLSA